jgi:hypothetical protein
MVDYKDHDGSECRDQNAIDIETGYASRPELGKKEAAYKCADHTKDKVHDKTAAGSRDYLAGDESSNQTKHNPCQDGHLIPPNRLRLYSLRPQPQRRLNQDATGNFVPYRLRNPGLHLRIAKRAEAVQFSRND